LGQGDGRGNSKVATVAESPKEQDKPDK